MTTAATNPDLPTIWRVPDALWRRIAPLLEVNKPRLKPGRPRRNDRPIFDALIYLARTGMQWSALPREFPPKSTVHDRLQEWVEFGCLAAAWAVLLQEYDATLGLDWQWQSADGCIVKAPLGKRTAEGDAQATGANPTDRGKSGCKRHLLTEGKGVPIAVVLSGANRHDMKKLATLLDAKVLDPPRWLKGSLICVLTGAMTMMPVAKPQQNVGISPTSLILRNQFLLQVTHSVIRLVAGWWKWVMLGLIAFGVY